MITKAEITFTCSIHSEEMTKKELINKLILMSLRLTVNKPTGSGVKSFEHSIFPKIKIVK